MYEVMSHQTTEKLFAPACERNQPYILEVLRRVFAESGAVLEVGSGTGQHAAYFSTHLPHLEWHPTELPGNLGSIEAYRREAGLSNLHEAAALDLEKAEGRQWSVQYLVCINTIHIVAWPLVEALFRLAGEALVAGGILFCYGPFRYANRPLEASNERFDQILRSRDPASGVRLFEDVDGLARANGLRPEGDEAMPANNRSIWWRAVDGAR